MVLVFALVLIGFIHASLLTNLLLIPNPHTQKPAEADGTMIGEKVVQDGVIAIPSPNSLGLCAGVTNAHYATTTEVYPDSPSATEEQCNRAQVACIDGGLQCIIREQNLAAVCKEVSKQ
jgi:hypothetical protein